MKEKQKYLTQALKEKYKLKKQLHSVFSYQIDK